MSTDNNGTPKGADAATRPTVLPGTDDTPAPRERARRMTPAAERRALGLSETSHPTGLTKAQRQQLDARLRTFRADDLTREQAAMLWQIVRQAMPVDEAETLARVTVGTRAQRDREALARGIARHFQSEAEWLDELRGYSPKGADAVRTTSERVAEALTYDPAIEPSPAQPTAHETLEVFAAKFSAWMDAYRAERARILEARRAQTPEQRGTGYMTPAELELVTRRVGFPYAVLAFGWIARREGDDEHGRHWKDPYEPTTDPAEVAARLRALRESEERIERALAAGGIA